ncbi:hypothetical protein D3C87_2107480 [compost metagenome]
MLRADLLLDLLPLDAERRIAEHVVEVPPDMTVIGQSVPRCDIGDVLPLDEHVRLADRIGFGV